MTSRVLRTAALSAVLLISPTAVWSADEPAQRDTPKPEAVKPDPARPEAPADTQQRPERPNQPGAGAEGRGRLDPAALLDRVSAALKEIGLSDEQKSKADELVAKAKKSVGELTGEGRERLQAAGKTFGELKDGLSGLLNEEQRRALAEKVPLLNRLAGLASGERPEQPRPGVLQQASEAALATLNLSDEQKAKIKVVTEDTQKKVRELMASAEGQRDAIREKVQPILNAQREKIAEILSPEQLEKYQSAVREQLEKLRGQGGDRGTPNGDRPRRPADRASEPAKPAEGEKRP